MNSSMTIGTPVNGAGQAVAIGVASVASSVFPAGTNVVRLQSTSDCFVAVGVGKTAVVNTSMFLSTGVPEYVTANAGDTVAVIQSGTAGTLYVIPMV